MPHPNYTKVHAVAGPARTKGKLIGPKPPLQPNHVGAIRTRLQLARQVRDLALFNLAIDSNLCGCDLVKLRVEDVAPHGDALDRATIRQRKTGRPVTFEISEQTLQAIDDYLKATGKRSGAFLLGGARTGTTASPSGSMRGWSRRGSPASASIHCALEPIHCAAPRRP